MSYTNYKKISYVLSEKPGISGMIAYEYIKHIIRSEDVLKFIVFGHGIPNDNLESFLTMHSDATILPGTSNEKVFILNHVDVNTKLLELLCSLGEYPNYSEIAKIINTIKLNNTHSDWKIEYSDELFTIIYNNEYIDDSIIELIEKNLKNKNICYERKIIKKLKTK